MNISKVKFYKMGLVFLLAFSISLRAFAQFPEANMALPGVTVLEAENLDLKSVKVIDNAAASNGKAVKILDKDSMVSTKLALKKGEYVANVIMFADSFEGDGFYLSVDNKVKRTATAHHHNKWVYGTKFITFKADGINPVTIRVSSRYGQREQVEVGMLLDRIELIELKSSADVLDYWTGSN